MSDKSLEKARRIRIENVGWKQWELDIIKNNYKNLSDQEIHQKFLPNRTKMAIARRRHDLKLHRGMQCNQVWTPEELELLYKHWRDYDQRELKQKFFPNKTVQQVRAAKMHRNLKKPPVWTNEERGVLLEHGANYTQTELQIKFFPNKTLSQISGMRKHLGIKRKKNA